MEFLTQNRETNHFRNSSTYKLLYPTYIISDHNCHEKFCTTHIGRYANFLFTTGIPTSNHAFIIFTFNIFWPPNITRPLTALPNFHQIKISWNCNTPIFPTRNIFSKLLFLSGVWFWIFKKILVKKKCLIATSKFSLPSFHNFFSPTNFRKENMRVNIMHESFFAETRYNPDHQLSIFCAKERGDFWHNNFPKKHNQKP